MTSLDVRRHASSSPRFRCPLPRFFPSGRGPAAPSTGRTEALTGLSEGHHLEGAREALQAQFTEQEQVKLTLMISIINGWNRISVGFSQFVDPAEARVAAAKTAA